MLDEYRIYVSILAASPWSMVQKCDSLMNKFFNFRAGSAVAQW